jgi:hypothetical protein
MSEPTTDAVITVGDARGFVIETSSSERYIITAAHCLAATLECCSLSGSDRIFPALLSKLGEAPRIWAECLFANPVADLAVLGTPDIQDLSKQADDYEALTESIQHPLVIGEASEDGKGWLQSLEGHWFGCRVQIHQRRSALGLRHNRTDSGRHVRLASCLAEWRSDWSCNHWKSRGQRVVESM